MSAALAALIAVAAAVGGRVAGWLTTGAAVVASVVGAAVLFGAGVGGLVLLGTFFVSGSLLSRRSVEGPRRRAAQVLANGWSAALGAAVIPIHAPLGWALLAGGLAAAQADTWATEIGRRSRRRPRLITSGTPVPVGTSGGVTLLGTLGGGAGAAVMALITQATPAPVAAGWILAAGIVGMLADSALGATRQAQYRCDACACAVETPRHCGTPAAHVGGLRWMTNDVVNALGTGAGAALAVLASGGWPSP